MKRQVLQRREFITILGGAATGWPVAILAQQPSAVRHIAMLLAGLEDAMAKQNIAAFKQELQKLGWIDGQNVRFETRFVSDDTDAIRNYAAELTGLAPDVIVTSSNLVTSIVGKQTRIVPIVFAAAGDAVGTGLVTNMAHPGGNITGFTTFEIATSSKLLELFKEALPGLTRVAVIYSEGPVPLEVLKLLQVTGPKLGMSISAISARDPDDIERAVDQFSREANGGLFVTTGPATMQNHKQIIALAAKFRLPAIYSNDFSVDGGLMSYAANQTDQYRRTASYVDRIMRGEKPGDLPVQAPVKYELLVNLKTAKAIDLEIAQSILWRADKVIE